MIYYSKRRKHLDDLLLFIHFRDYRYIIMYIAILETVLISFTSVSKQSFIHGVIILTSQVWGCIPKYL